MKHSYFKIPGWFNMHEAYDQLLENCPDGSEILEIGSFMGRSTSYLATNIINSGKRVHVYALDTFEGSSEHANLDIDGGFYETFKENCKAFIDGGVVTPVKSRSDDANTLKRWADGHFHGIIVDGAHEYDAVQDDILNWWPKLKENGTMVGDDYLLNSVATAVKDGFTQLQVPNFGANRGVEQTWYCSKGNNNKVFEKRIPGVNAYA